MQVLSVHVDGHQSYWFVTRPEQTNLPHIVQFRDWLQQEVWLAKRHLEPSSPLPQVPLA